jgi:hypothetical protein
MGTIAGLLQGTAQVWIVTEDQDYFIRHNKRPLLNSLLYRDLTEACGVELSVWLFDKLDDGIIDFSKKAGVKAEDLPTEQEAKEIKEEIETLAPIGWMNDTSMALPPHLMRFRGRAIYQDDSGGWPTRPWPPCKASAFHCEQLKTSLPQQVRAVPKSQ